MGSGRTHQAVELIEEEGAHAGANHRVEVFENEDARRVGSCVVEYRSNAVFGAYLCCERFDIEGGLAALLQQDLDALRFAVPWRTEEEETCSNARISSGTERKIDTRTCGDLDHIPRFQVIPSD